MGARQRSETLEVADEKRKETLLEKMDEEGGGRDLTEKRQDANDDTEMDDLVGKISALKFVPPSVRFGGRGRGRGRGGFSRS